MLAGTPGTTVTDICPVMPPDAAEINAIPLRVPVIKPVELTEAMEEFELDHVTLDAGDPFGRFAAACTEVPDGKGFVGTVIDRVAGGSVDPPQAARMRQKPASVVETSRIWRSPFGGLQLKPSTVVW